MYQLYNDFYLQGMAEFLMQGKYSAASLGHGRFADSEIVDLPGKYGFSNKPQTVSELLNKVSYAC